MFNIVTTDINHLNMVDVLEQIAKQEYKEYKKIIKNSENGNKNGNAVVDFIELRKQHVARRKALKKCYHIDKETFVEQVLRQINGSYAYENNSIENLTCSYGKLWLPVIDPKTNNVSVEQHTAIYYTLNDDRFDVLKKPTMYSLEEAKETYEFVLKQLYLNKIILLREDDKNINVGPKALDTPFTYKTITYDRYPEYALGENAKQLKVISGIAEKYANQLVRKNLENLGVKFELVEQKSILKNILNVFKKQNKSDVHEILEKKVEQKEYKVKITNNNNVQYLKKSSKRKDNSIRQYGD